MDQENFHTSASNNHRETFITARGFVETTIWNLSVVKKNEADLPTRNMLFHHIAHGQGGGTASEARQAMSAIPIDTVSDLDRVRGLRDQLHFALLRYAAEKN